MEIVFILAAVIFVLVGVFAFLIALEYKGQDNLKNLAGATFCFLLAIALGIAAATTERFFGYTVSTKVVTQTPDKGYCRFTLYKDATLSMNNKFLSVDYDAVDGKCLNIVDLKKTEMYKSYLAEVIGVTEADIKTTK